MASARTLPTFRSRSRTSLTSLQPTRLQTICTSSPVEKATSATFWPLACQPAAVAALKYVCNATAHTLARQDFSYAECAVPAGGGGALVPLGAGNTTSLVCASRIALQCDCTCRFVTAPPPSTSTSTGAKTTTAASTSLPIKGVDRYFDRALDFRLSAGATSDTVESDAGALDRSWSVSG